MNKFPHAKIYMLVNKTRATNFAKKHTDKHPTWNNKSIMYLRWFLQKYFSITTSKKKAT
jgi:hypothetical protein